ncbi:phage protein [Staphylococcus phage SaGU1]|uniref:Phage protein n=1 Tax=Staphylococcus phage SaGU1 TaxID=2758660 RepID=A0A8S0GA10_9CAUD|nr:tail fiber protein [Staphylococcus phage Biyabeda-mokiny_2]WJJ56919.1 tail fiber protein [Staphylococcus phage vB_SAP01]BCJ89030.1 phage protein [Staphylococcus phage SaGU1]
MTRQFDIGRDEIVLHLREGKYITGFTTAGAYDTDFGQIKVNREILPAYFFDNFAYERYLYYSKPEEVIENKDYVPPQINNGDEESQQNTVPKEQYDSLKEELELMRKQQEAMMEMLQKLLGQKG